VYATQNTTQIHLGNTFEVLIHKHFQFDCSSYLETIRIDKAKKMLEHGVLPIDVAFKTGFTDQSHFSNLFKKFIGLTPKQYMNIFKDARN